MDRSATERAKSATRWASHVNHELSQHSNGTADQRCCGEGRDRASSERKAEMSHAAGRDREWWQLCRATLMCARGDQNAQMKGGGAWFGMARQPETIPHAECMAECAAEPILSE